MGYQVCDCGPNELDFLQDNPEGIAQGHAAKQATVKWDRHTAGTWLRQPTHVDQ